MATLETRLVALVNAIGADIKALKAADGDLTALSTTAKSNLVAAINEVYIIATTGSTLINDAASLTTLDKTWSVKHISDSILQAKNDLRTELTNGASAALDTFGELAAALTADESTATVLATAVANRVRFDASQTLTLSQKLQARQNIDAVGTLDIGNPDADLLAAYTAAKT